MSEFKLMAELTGRVCKIERSVGSEVNADDPILILESMKMEIPVITDKHGTVTKLHVSEGDEVVEGQLLATIACK
jgi:acetyl-CoA carboxylase biotin carboxyl carrier protein